MAKKVTINMVAKRAGVSRGTVDRVLNRRPHVRPEAYEKVLLAMKELNYIPPNDEWARELGLDTPYNLPCKLGIVLPNWSGYFRQEIMKGIEDAKGILDACCVDVLIEECKTDLTDEMIEKMDSLCSQGVAGLSICAKDNDEIADKINILHKKGIPVITYNSDVTDSRRLCFVGQDLLRSGRVAGDLMTKCLRPGEKLLIAIGNSAFNAHRLRMQGFSQRIHESDFKSIDIEIIETYNDYVVTYQKVKEVLERVPDLKGIYMANHSVAGCTEAIRTTGLQGKIHIICHDLTDETKHLLKKHEVDFAIAQNIYLQGYQPLLILREFIQQNISPHMDEMQPSIEIVCAENL